MRSAQSVCLSDRGSYAFGGDLETIVALSCTDRWRLTGAGPLCQRRQKAGGAFRPAAFNCVRELFLQRKDPADEGLDVGVRNLRIRRHGNLAPYADAAFLDLLAPIL